MTDTVVIADEGAGYKFSWGLALAGAFAATAITFFLLTIGAGFGLLLVKPGAHSGPTVFLTGGAIYFFAAQAFGFAAGGHFAGRLLGPILEARSQEDFRAGAHGLAVWAITVVAILFLIALAGLTTAGSGVAALYGSGATANSQSSSPTNYLLDKLYRPGGGTTPEGARQEAGRILDASFAHGVALTSDDRARLVALVGRNAGVTGDEATRRVDTMQADTLAKIRQVTEAARKAASYASLWIGFSLLFGVIVAIFAAISARIEDDRESGKAQL